MGQVILFGVIILVGTSGEMCVSRAMKGVGEVKDFRPRPLSRVFLRALSSGWMWAGVGFMATAFFALLGALSLNNVSFVVPVTALSYVAGAVGGTFFLGEHVTRQRWLGVLCVVIGVTLVVLAKR